jgi:hypothetical protein
VLQFDETQHAAVLSLANSAREDSVDMGAFGIRIIFQQFGENCRFSGHNKSMTYKKKIQSLKS